MPLITPLRPNSVDRTFGTVQIVPSGTAATVTDDAPSDDTSYVTSAFAGSGVSLGMDDVALAANQRVKFLRVRLRMFHNSADVGWREYVDVRLRGSVTGSTTTKSTLGTVSDTALEQSTGVWSLDPLGNPWTQLGVNRTQVDLAWAARAASPSITQLRVTEVYLDVDVHTQPSVSAVTVTGTTTTSRPSVSFTYTDPDNTDPQTRYQVAVYTAAQVASPTFEAGVSVDIWHTTGTGPGNQAVVGKDLQTGVTYQAFVRAAKDWSGPDGPLWWSDWVSSGAFTMNLLPPPTPTLTATADPTLPGYRVLLNATAPLNLLTLNQASLETDTAGWTALSNCSVSRSTAAAADGSASLQMSSTAAGTMTAETSTRPQVLAGAQYVAVASVRSATAARTVRVGIRWYDQAGALIGTTNFGSTATSTTAGFTAASSTQTAPSNAFTASVVLEVQSTAAGAELHRWDKIGLQAGSSTAWSAGGGRSSAAVLVERLVSASQERGPSDNLAHPQLASGGALTFGTDGFYPRTTSVIRSAPIDGPPPAGLTGAGARMIVWHPLVGAFNGVDIGLNNSSTTDPAPPYLLPAVPGRTQTGSIYLRGSSAVNAHIFLIPVDTANVQVGAGTEVASTTAALPTTGWSRYTATITPPAGTAYLRMFVELTAGNQDLDVFMTGVQLVLGSAAQTLAPGTGDGFATWQPVRQLESAAPTIPGERFAIIDHEAPPAVPLLYRATLQTTTSTGDVLSSAPSAVVAVVLDAPARTVIKDPFQPENAAIANVWPGDQAQQAEDVAELHGAGRDDDPVFLRSWVGRTRSWELSALSDLEHYRLLQLIRSSRSLLLQWPEGGQTYVRVTGWQETRTTIGLYKTISISGAQTARPA